MEEKKREVDAHRPVSTRPNLGLLEEEKSKIDRERACCGGVTGPWMENRAGVAGERDLPAASVGVDLACLLGLNDEKANGETGWTACWGKAHSGWSNSFLPICSYFLLLFGPNERIFIKILFSTKSNKNQIK